LESPNHKFGAFSKETGYKSINFLWYLILEDVQRVAWFSVDKVFYGGKIIIACQSRLR